MSALVWPTHKARARKSANGKIYRKKLNKRLRRLASSGKRGVHLV